MNAMNDSSEYANHRILVIDDNPAIHRDFEKILHGTHGPDAEMLLIEGILLGDRASVVQPSFEVEFASQGKQGVGLVERAVAERRPFALAFIDMRMPPGWDGLETIERLWAVDPNVQVVVCSAHSDYDWADFVRRLGYSDKLLVLKKPFEPIEVLQCATALTRKWRDAQLVRRQLEALEQVVTTRTQGLEAANQQLRHLATHDALTGLPNRVLLDDRLEQAIAHSDRHNEPFAVLVLDLDRFKVINDSLGHRAGDEFLNVVAQRLSGVVSGVDTVARIGGDEFVLIVSRAPEREKATQVADRVIASLSQPVRICGVDLHASTSIGIAFYPKDGQSADALLAQADAAMYCAKQRGRNNMQCFEPGMDTITRERFKLESALHEALEKQQFELHYQPKVDTESGRITSAEALIRWRHPERGLITPDEFIPLAEECGLISVIGEWVLREACRQCNRWQRDGLPPLRIAINVAASQFRQGNLLHVIRNALDGADLDPRYLELELTESAVMTNPEESATILEQLSAMGVLVSVDDFGTGYSSMSYLRRFPIDKLKIDRGFVKDLLNRADDASIVQAIISLAHSLRLKVVAEGVETAEQLSSLKSMGCDQYQGYHFSPPLPAAEFGELIKRGGKEQFSMEDALRTHSKLAVYRR